MFHWFFFKYSQQGRRMHVWLMWWAIKERATENPLSSIAQWTFVEQEPVLPLVISWCTSTEVNGDAPAVNLAPKWSFCPCFQLSVKQENLVGREKNLPETITGEWEVAASPSMLCICHAIQVLQENLHTKLLFSQPLYLLYYSHPNPPKKDKKSVHGGGGRRGILMLNLCTPVSISLVMVSSLIW